MRWLGALALATLALGVHAPVASATDCTYDPPNVLAGERTGLLGFGMVGEAFSKSITASGGSGNYTWQNNTFPPGLGRSGGNPGATITILGTPTQAGHFRV